MSFRKSNRQPSIKTLLVELFIQTINTTLIYQQKHFQELCSCINAVVFRQ